MTQTFPCREYQGARTAGGYGVYKGRYIHRWVMEQAGHDIIGKVVMHLCDNRACFRYDHLRVGTTADNNTDMIAKGRARHYGKPQVITPDQHEEIATRYLAGESQGALAAEFGISTSQVSRIVQGQGVPTMQGRRV